MPPLPAPVAAARYSVLSMSSGRRGYPRWPGCTGHPSVKRWSKCGQMPVKMRSNAGQNAVECWSKCGQMLVQRGSVGAAPGRGPRREFEFKLSFQSHLASSFQSLLVSVSFHGPGRHLYAALGEVEALGREAVPPPHPVERPVRRRGVPHVARQHLRRAPVKTGRLLVKLRGKDGQTGKRSFLPHVARRQRRRVRVKQV